MMRFLFAVVVSALFVFSVSANDGRDRDRVDQDDPNVERVQTDSDDSDEPREFINEENGRDPDAKPNNNGR